MDRNVSSFTVCFQPPFWVGIAERWTADGYEAARLYPLKPGIATITCRVTLPDGTWAEGYCSVYVRSS